MDRFWKWIARAAWLIAIFLFLKSWRDNMESIKLFWDKLSPWQFMFFLVLLAAFFASWRISLIKYRKPTKGPARVIKNPAGYQYLVEGDTCFHIPDPDTFNYLGNFFGFSWGDSQLMQPDEIKRNFKTGRALPSIRVYFPKKEN